MLKSNSRGFCNFIRSILPPPPDVRKVKYKELQAMDKPDWMSMDVPEQGTEFGVVQQERKHNKKTAIKTPTNRPEITNLNTTFIGDYTATIFPPYNVKWLVQATGNATFSSTIENIKNGQIVVDRKYIFIQLGGNQLRMADKVSVFRNVMETTVAIRDRSPESRIFFLAVLPRIVDNKEIKPLLVKFN